MLTVDRKCIGKAFLAIPLAAVLFASDFITKPEPLNISDLMAGKVFGRVMLDGHASYIATMENITFIILFLFLFSNYISEHFRYSAVYVFTRIRNRQKWCFIHMVELMIYDAIYVALYMVIIYCACCHRSTNTPSIHDLQTLVFIYIFAVLLVLLTSIMTNIFVLSWGTAVGVIAALLTISGLIFVAISTPNCQWLQVVNPFSCMDFLEKSIVLQIASLCSSVGLTALSAFVLTRKVYNYDVALFDLELK